MKFIILTILVFGLTFSAEAQKRGSVAAVKKDCVPAFTASMMRNFLRGKTIDKIDSASNEAQLEGWTFDPDELIEVDIIETNLTPKTAVSVVQIKTGSAPGEVEIVENKVNAKTLEGRLRLNFELIAGEWTLLKIENLSLKYTELEANLN